MFPSPLSFCDCDNSCAITSVRISVNFLGKICYPIWHKAQSHASESEHALRIPPLWVCLTGRKVPLSQVCLLSSAHLFYLQLGWLIYPAASAPTLTPPPPPTLCIPSRGYKSFIQHVTPSSMTDWDLGCIILKLPCVQLLKRLTAAEQQGWSSLDCAMECNNGGGRFMNGTISVILQHRRTAASCKYNTPRTSHYHIQFISATTHQGHTWNVIQ